MPNNTQRTELDPHQLKRITDSMNTIGRELANLNRAIVVAMKSFEKAIMANLTPEEILELKKFLSEQEERINPE